MVALFILFQPRRYVICPRKRPPSGVTRIDSCPSPVVPGKLCQTNRELTHAHTDS